MRQIRLEPVAPMLLESMRAIGYEAPSAVADLIDNSITANARRVELVFPAVPPFWFAIIDDGDGMSSAELEIAMRHGSRNPNDQRRENDLGRFGLGLKTASMSQCRRLTVVTRRDGVTSGMRWDLDEVAAANDWFASVLDEADLEEVPGWTSFRTQLRGTLVAWEKLDRLAQGDRGDGVVLGERIEAIAQHLSLVFHRFLDARGDERLEIRRNGLAVTAADPFLENAGSDVLPEERMEVEGHTVTLRPYTLPHISRLSPSQIERAGGDVGLRRQQGFYVYRQKRLIIWGTWFRLSRQEELKKLTRVRVDVPNSLDHLWNLDVKKSMASPPAVLRDRLRSLIPKMVGPSVARIRHRGRETGTAGIVTMWNRIDDRGAIRYELNAQHPLIEAFRDACADDGLAREFMTVLRAVAVTLPVEPIYNDRANDRIGFKLDASREDIREITEQLEELARQILAGVAARPEARAALLAQLPGMEPFASHPKITTTLQARLSKC